jgi:hypothetical protein
MLGITRWTPWTELAGRHRDLDSIVGRVFGEAVPRQTVDSFDSLNREASSTAGVCFSHNLTQSA